MNQLIKEALRRFLCGADNFVGGFGRQLRASYRVEDML